MILYTKAVGIAVSVGGLALVTHSYIYVRACVCVC